MTAEVDGAARVPGLRPLGEVVEAARRDGELVVQPRMGFSDPGLMARGLAATLGAAARVAGTLTLDSYTRLGDYTGARAALEAGVPLNGYPLVNHGPDATRRLVGAAIRQAAPHGAAVQVRHGSPLPLDIFTALVAAGLEATEGGPVSYCMPYSREPLAAAVDNWKAACDFLAGTAERGGSPHLETFGGCLLGQLCPPGLLVAVSVLEGVFFRQRGLRDISLSYAQQTSHEQDVEALAALRSLAAELLPDVRLHLVLYTYMGVYPRSRSGAYALLADAVETAVAGGAERLVVKTPAEAHRIPTVEENIETLEFAAAVAKRVRAAGPAAGAPDTGLRAEAAAIVHAVLELHPDVGQAMVLAFRRGLLDIPYCLHPDNPGRSSGFIDSQGWLCWGDVGGMPIRGGGGARRRAVTSAQLLEGLSYVQRRYDAAALPERHRELLGGAAAAERGTR